MDPLVIRPGELRSLVVIQSPNYVSDGGGMSVTPAAWTTVLTMGAAIYTAGGRETTNASQIVSSCTHVVKVRYTPTVIKPNFQVLYNGRFFTVQYVENVKECNRVLLLYCQEVDGGGQ